MIVHHQHIYLHVIILHIHYHHHPHSDYRAPPSVDRPRSPPVDYSASRRERSPSRRDDREIMDRDRDRYSAQPPVASSAAAAAATPVTQQQPQTEVERAAAY